MNANYEITFNGETYFFLEYLIDQDVALFRNLECDDDVIEVAVADLVNSLTSQYEYHM
jgi:hypothetical protein